VFLDVSCLNGKPIGSVPSPAVEYAAVPTLAYLNAALQSQVTSAADIQAITQLQQQQFEHYLAPLLQQQQLSGNGFCRWPNYLEPSSPYTGVYNNIGIMNALYEHLVALGLTSVRGIYRGRLRFFAVSSEIYSSFRAFVLWPHGRLLL
jgi:hypothetical protein